MRDRRALASISSRAVHLRAHTTYYPGVDKDVHSIRRARPLPGYAAITMGADTSFPCLPHDTTSKLPKAEALTATTCPGRNVLVLVAAAPRFLAALPGSDMHFSGLGDSPHPAPIADAAIRSDQIRSDRKKETDQIDRYYKRGMGVVRSLTRGRISDSRS